MRIGLSPGKCFIFLLSSSDFIFKINLFEKFFHQSVLQTAWIQIRPDVASGLIWFQTVCKIYQQTTSGDKGGPRRGTDNEILELAEYMALLHVYIRTCKIILLACMCSCLVRLCTLCLPESVYIFVHSLYVRAVKVLVRL